MARAITVGMIVLGHDRVGSGPRTVIVLNDWTSDTSTWDGARAYLDVTRFTWAFTDLRGYGRSIARDGAFTVAEAATDIIELADAQGWERFAIVGHSMSSLIALHLAQRHPERVERVVVLTPPPPAGFGADEATLEGIRALARGDDTARIAAFEQRSGQRLSPGFCAYKAARWRATAAPAAVSAYAAVFARDGMPDTATRITVPVLAVAGEHDVEAMRSAAVTRALTPLCERLDVVALAESGHYPMQELPALLVAHVERFLAGLASLDSLGPANEGLAVGTVKEGERMQKRGGPLEPSEAFLSSLVENLPDMVFVKDAQELRFIRVNRAAETILGISRDELIGKCDHDFFPKDEADFFTAKDRAVLASGTLLEIPVEPIHTKDKGLRFLHTKKIPIFDPNGEPLYLLGISEDITERKLAEEERDRSRSRVTNLEAERELREQFVFTLSHDLRTPLTTILAAAQLLAHHPEKLDLIATVPNRIIRSAHRADRMIQDLLDVTRIAAGNPLPMKPVATDLAVLAADVVGEWKGLGHNAITLDVTGPLDGWWSASEVARALENLVSNAIKHGAPGGAIAVAIRGSDDNEVSISVHNFGEPIAPEELEVIFETFRRSPSVQTKGTKGWGLGLTLVKAIAEAHGGRVRVASSPSDGTRFEVVLPRDARRREAPQS